MTAKNVREYRERKQKTLQDEVTIKKRKHKNVVVHVNFIIIYKKYKCKNLAMCFDVSTRDLATLGEDYYLCKSISKIIYTLPQTKKNCLYLRSHLLQLSDYKFPFFHFFFIIDR